MNASRFHVTAFRLFLGCLLWTRLNADPASAFASAAPEKPNIVVVYTDDQGWADLSCQGVVPDVKTPHIDRLADGGVRFTSGYVTAPQCVPSRAGLIAGCYQQRFGLGHNGLGPLPLDVPTLADRLQRAGYTTGMVGKWHLNPNPSCRDWVARHLPQQRGKPPRKVRIPNRLQLPYQPGQRGFREFFVGQLATYRANFDRDGASRAAAGETLRSDGYRLETQSEAALAFIRRCEKRPFFLYLAYFAPHVPLEAPRKYLARFPGKMPERRRYALAMLSAVDDGVGQILQLLESRRMERQTLVVFVSDNGAPLKIDKQDLPITVRGAAWDGSLNDPWVGEKGMLTEGGIRVPFLMYWPGVLPAGLVYDEPVITLDIAATACALGGHEDSRGLDGVNLVPFLTGETSGAPHAALYWRFWGQAAIRCGPWKLLCLADGRRYLFDLDSPDHERKNVLGKHPETVARLTQQLEDWAAQLQPPGLPRGQLNAQEIAWYRHYLGSNNPD